MKTKYIFKALALAMLMPAMLLTTACSNEDDVVNNTENIANKGYELPVTVNVTRQDATAGTRTTYTDNGNKTGSLAFSAGDKLFVKGNDTSASGAGFFAGTLTWKSGGTFSGTILTENAYSGTIDALFTAPNTLATLIPDNYVNSSYFSFTNEGTYKASVTPNYTKTFATSKATAVEQFSNEVGGYTSGTGFTLKPTNAILNFTITGLAANTGVDVAFSDGVSFTISGGVTTNVSGTATFAIGVRYYNTDLKDFTLKVGGKSITLVSSSKTLEAGKIYNITRSAGATVDLSTKNTAYTAQNGETLTGTLASNVKISIAEGATVILDGVTINGENSDMYNYAGITCEGDATIILSGTNNVKGFYEDYPGIYVPENKTVTIQGTGSLTASSNGYGAGIGGCGTLSGNCGNITINGGNITATGGSGRAGIGGGTGACGNITITGGTIAATGGESAPGIGGGIGACGNITITSGTIAATKGNNAPYSIGAGGFVTSTCGTVTIGGIETGNITTSPYIYPLGVTVLSTINANYTASNGEILTGTLGNNVKISIADGATVTLNNVNINGSGTWTSGNYAGITCEGNATIILSGTNTVKGFYEDYPGIYVAENKTVTIQGTGSLTASSNGSGAGIGCGKSENCGNITINGGNITATGGGANAGIGGGYGACGNITITGGTITATGSGSNAGIGGGIGACGNITITSGVTRVTATKGDDAPNTNSIGAGGFVTSSCGTVKFGDQTMYDGSNWTTTPTSGSAYGGLNLTISQTTYANDTWTLTPVTP